MKKFVLLFGLALSLFLISSVSASMQQSMQYNMHPGMNDCFGCVNNGYSYGDFESRWNVPREKVNVVYFEWNQEVWAQPFFSSKHFGEPLVGAEANQYNVRRGTYQMSYGYYDNPQLHSHKKY